MLALCKNSLEHADKKKAGTYARRVNEIIELLRTGSYMEALNKLDKFCEEGNDDIVLYARAILRNIVLDLSGAISDLDNLSRQNEDVSLLRASVLARAGKMDESQSILKRLKTLRGVGIGGRRMDLSLVGITESAVPVHFLKGWEVGCVAGHLMALGEWKGLETAFDYMTEKERMQYYKIFQGFKREKSLFQKQALGGIAKEIEGVDGWLSPDEAEFLFSLAKDVQEDSKIVEIGSFCGRSTISLSMGSREGFQVKVHSVDPHMGLEGIHNDGTYDEILNNLKRRQLLPYVTLHRDFSINVAKSWKGRDIGLLFIDAEHSYDSVREDFGAWCPHLMEGSMVVFHDYPLEGPNEFIKEILREDFRLVPISFMDSLFLFRFQFIGKRRNESLRKVFFDYVELMGRGYRYWVDTEKEEATVAAIKVLESMKPYGEKEVNRHGHD